MSVRLLNKDSNPNNMLKLPASFCDCGDTETCNQSGTGAALETDLYSGVHVDGVFFSTSDAALTVANVEEVNAEILAAIEAAGYYEVKDSTYAYDGTDWSFDHTGEASVGALTIGGVKTDLTEACDASYVCDNTLVYTGGAASVLVIDGVDFAFANELVYGTNVVADVEAELTAVLPAGTVFTVEDITSAWKITIEQPQGAELSLDGKDAQECNCKLFYAATK